MSMGTKEEEEPATDVTTTQAPRPARQLQSGVSKTAFWASVAMTVLGIGGLITIALGSGTVSQEILITSVGWLICAAILATRARWAPVVVTLLEACIFYLICTQPYVTESLTNPKGSNGGLGHFIGDVLVVAGAMVALGSSLASAMQNYGGGSRQTPRWYPSLMNLIAGMAIGATFIGIIVPQPSISTGLTYTNGIPTVHMNVNSFLQSSVTISKGSKLLLVDDSTAEHDLFNGSWQNGAPDVAREPGAPQVNNIKLSKDSTTIGPFAIAGTYHIFCTLHQGMELTITVQ